MNVQVKRAYKWATVFFIATVISASYSYNHLQDGGWWPAIASFVGVSSLMFALFCITQAQQKKKALDEEAWREKERKYELELAEQARRRDAIDQFQNWLEAHQTREKYSKLQQANEQQMIQRFGPRKISVKE